MFDNLKNIASMFGNARQMRQRMEEVQAALARKTVDGDAGAGAVVVTMNGKFEVVSVKLDRPLLQALMTEGPADSITADQRMIEDLLVAAYNAAQVKAQELVKQEISKMTGGIDISGLLDKAGDRQAE